MKGLAVRFALIILSAPTPSALGFVLTTKVDKMVVFLFNDAPQFGINCQGSIESKGRKLCPLGTAFYTGFPDKEDKAKCWSVIATAQHVVRGQRVLFGADATPTDMTLYARNTTGQDEVCAPLDSAKWKYFSDPKLDVAVYLSNVPGMERTECVQAPMFATEATLKEKRITQGDSVFTLAMVPELVGAKRNYPVARQVRLRY